MAAFLSVEWSPVASAKEHRSLILSVSLQSFFTMMLLIEVLKWRKKLLAFVRLRQHTEAGVLGEESQGACSRRQHINEPWSVGINDLIVK